MFFSCLFIKNVILKFISYLLKNLKSKNFKKLIINVGYVAFYKTFYTNLKLNKTIFLYTNKHLLVVSMLF